MSTDDTKVHYLDPTGMGVGVTARRGGIGGRSDIDPYEMLKDIIARKSLEGAAAVVVITLCEGERDIELFCSSPEIVDAAHIIDRAKFKIMSGGYDHDAPA